MKKAIVVIGSNYGDEAKGAYTDFFASQNPNSIVIRFNGGAQAGHTVQAENKRHVFSHFGSGSSSGTPTYLSEFFVNHPMLFIQEWDNLASKNIPRKIYVHPEGLVTTPWDMMLNQLKEMKRRKTGKHHGSVGVGFGETIERQSHDFGLKVHNLKSQFLLGSLRAIKNIYFPEQIRKFQLEEELEFFKETINSQFIEDNFLKDIKFFLSKVFICNYSVINNFETSIFEGAQGLLLDMDHGDFPHVTRSNTGLHNVLKILPHLEERTVDVFYLSRPYLSKHGAGTLDRETEKLQGFDIIDNTNKPHEYQGNLRFAPLNYQELNDRIDRDFATSRKLETHRFTRNICFSCLDQVSASPMFILGDNSGEEISQELYLRFLRDNSSYCSYGPTRNDIESNR